MLYEKISGQMGADLPDFLEWKQKKWIPFVRRTGGALIGLWHCVVGDVGTFLEIWAYEDYAALGRAAKLYHEPPLEEDRQTLAEIRKYHINPRVELLRSASLAPTRDVSEGVRGT